MNRNSPGVSIFFLYTEEVLLILSYQVHASSGFGTCFGDNYIAGATSPCNIYLTVSVCLRISNNKMGFIFTYWVQHNYCSNTELILDRKRLIPNLQ